MIAPSSIASANRTLSKVYGSTTGTDQALFTKTPCLNQHSERSNHPPNIDHVIVIDSVTNQTLRSMKTCCKDSVVVLHLEQTWQHIETAANSAVTMGVNNCLQTIGTISTWQLHHSDHPDHHEREISSPAISTTMHLRIRLVATSAMHEQWFKLAKNSRPFSRLM